LKESPDKTGILVDREFIFFDDLTQELFSRGSQLRFKARGWSMYPFIHDGDVLLIRPQRAAPPNIGDIILYRRPWGAYVVHRLIKRDNSHAAITRGDNVIECDPPVAIESIMGCVIRIENNHRKLLLTGFSSNLLGYFIASFGRVRFRGQVRVTRLLGRLHWLIGGRRIA
jgi:hypothetical protein